MRTVEVPFEIGQKVWLLRWAWATRQDRQRLKVVGPWTVTGLEINRSCVYVIFHKRCGQQQKVYEGSVYGSAEEARAARDERNQETRTARLAAKEDA